MFYGTWAENPGSPVLNPFGVIGWAGHNNCSSALIGGYGYLSVKWEQTQKFTPILFFPEALKHDGDQLLEPLTAFLIICIIIPRIIAKIQAANAYITSCSDIPMNMAGTITPIMQKRMESHTLRRFNLG
jgi:hypothetical protein